MENINELPKPVQERIEELKTRDRLEGEELGFMMARRDYLTDEEKENLLPKEEVVENVKKVGKTAFRKSSTLQRNK